MTGRTQCVEIGGCKSDFLPISCGVPQGSILGPLLFLVFINDMKISITCDLSLYADDSALLFSHKDASVIGERLSKELALCNQWLVDNKLSLHVGKTECILFGSKRRLKGATDFSVNLDGNAVTQVFHAKYLGVLLDSNVNGSLHAANLLKVSHGRLAFLYRNASLLDSHTRKILCSALIQPFLDYCCSSWYDGLPALSKTRLETFQRKMVRFILGFDNRHHVGPTEFRSLNWLTIPDRVLFFKLTHLFKIRKGRAPNYLRTRFTSVSDTHAYRTRSSHVNFHLSGPFASVPASFAFSSAKQWNALPNRIKEIESLVSFKRELRKYLFSRYD